jgi:hypothetical protein
MTAKTEARKLYNPPQSPLLTFFNPGKSGISVDRLEIDLKS